MLVASATALALPHEPLAPQARADEPDELSWEHFATCLHCFGDFTEWVADSTAAWEKARRSAAEAGLVTDPPKEFSTLWFEAEDFPLRGKTWSVIEAERHAGRPVSGTGLLRGRYGHNAGFVRRSVTVLKAGAYRLWVRYWHLKGHHASFRVRVLPAQMVNYEFGWQTSAQGEWLNHRFDFAEHGRKQPVLSIKDEPTGFVWECTPLVELPAGPLGLELAGCIHSGSYTFRHVDCLVLTEDPLWMPGALVGSSGVAFPPGAVVPDLNVGGGAIRRPSLPAGTHAEARRPNASRSTRPPSAETVKLWDLWCARPGTRSSDRVPTAVRECWLDWRNHLLTRLANSDTPTLHLRRLARSHCFDSDWNLIGTPAQVAEEGQRLGGLDRSGKRWYQVIEAESMTESVAGWAVEKNSLSGGGERMRAHYCDGLAEMTSQIAIPHEGRYRLWVHHSRIKGYTNLFQIRLERKGDDAPKAFRFGEEPADSGGYRMIWSSHEVELSSGNLGIVLSKNRGKGPYAYRHVDRIILTDDTTWQPEGVREPPLTASEIRGWIGGNTGSETPQLAVWRAAHTWHGFDMSTTRPGPEDDVMPDTIALQVGTGEVVSALLHMANPSEQAVTMNPGTTGAASRALSWRVVAYTLSKPFGWQPMPLLRRRQLTVPPQCIASLWLTVDARKLPPGKHGAVLNLGPQSVDIVMDVESFDLEQHPSPLVGGWTRPYAFPEAWKTFADVGLDLIHGVMIPKPEMDALGIRLLNVTLRAPADAEHVRRVVGTTEAMGLSYSDWSWEVFDEPSDKTAAKWATGAKAVRDADPRVRIWCNPGDTNVCHTEAIRTMAPYIDVFCPFINHFGRWPDGEHAKQVGGIGQIKLFYTTPCAAEKAPHAPLDMLHLAEQAQRLERDGWDFFCLKNYYEYCNTPWDDVWSYHRDQAVSIYPGAGRQVISTRNLEALREAIRRWRRAEG
ncbi:MAG: hypothetical protein HN742_36115 [Lentisphaerae bacterium]|nr:hypothetical protein [Lentisphaerota bacterium]MBT4817153.1 hypothetical protein [Lentisphaerota bacterium]MBT5604828.1 hypothetical protein [Lentisphaerota bacterium]MBT7056091.1 hypothetical protein [Lentisphaerota bacterium]MBT7847352.1 hypothetical protein [Lentisphaerota bacterium]